MSKEQRKEKAIKYMELLNIYEPYIKKFEKYGVVCLFENYGGYYIEEESDVGKAVRKFEETHNCTVYAVTHEITDFGELYDLLIVTDEEEEWDNLVDIGTDPDNGLPVARCFAYVINKDEDLFSEFGSVGIRSFGGGIKRVM